jgi:aminopeptidase N
MDLPHATYLLSLCGGPFDIKKDNWEGVDIWYVVPRGQGKYIDYSFGHTKDMLSFYSKILGVKYPWPKYAQNAMYDFSGGMENVSATTLGQTALTDSKEGYYLMDSVNSHELGHQWFGDFVTCKDWGDIFLNESFATYMQDMYFDHSRGKNGYDWEIADNISSYLREAGRYKRPLSTKMYPNADAMFDSHTYPKGGTILHTLRRWMGDEGIFKGLHSYLAMWQHTPVESAQLRRAMTEASGKNCEPFWAQWIDKPGHPVLDYTWTMADDGNAKLTVKQVQDTSDGTPVYSDVTTKVGWISQGRYQSMPVTLDSVEQTFVIPVNGVKPDAVIFDPDHDFLREIPALHWEQSELLPIMEFAPCAPDRYEALRQLCKVDGISDDLLLKAASIVERDNSQFPAFRTLFPLSILERPALRPFFIGQLKSVDTLRQADAASALGRLPEDKTATEALRALVNDKSPSQAVINAINALARWNKAANQDVIKKAQTLTSKNDRIRRAADRLLQD